MRVPPDAPFTMRLGELFSGPGGMAVGAYQAARLPLFEGRLNLEHAWASDYDLDSVKTYIGALKPFDVGVSSESVIHEDVRRLCIEQLGAIDGFAFGFPCNDYSLVGERKGINGEFGPLYSYGVRVLEQKRPGWFVAENVGGLRSHADTLQMILGELAGAGPGYELTTHLYRFEEYGIPQKRHRVIIVGISHDIGRVFRVPKPTTPHRSQQVTAEQALMNISQDASNHEIPRHGQRVTDRLKQILPGQNAWNADLDEHLKIHVNGATLSQIYKRLKPDEPSYTVTGSGGGGTSMYHWVEPRALTNRERARLQTFDDDHVFEGRRTSVRRQVGMAVPPRGAKVIFEALFKTLLGIDYPSVQPSLSSRYKLERMS